LASGALARKANAGAALGTYLKKKSATPPCQSRNHAYLYHLGGLVLRNTRPWPAPKHASSRPAWTGPRFLAFVFPGDGSIMVACVMWGHWAPPGRTKALVPGRIWVTYPFLAWFWPFMILFSPFMILFWPFYGTGRHIGLKTPLGPGPLGTPKPGNDTTNEMEGTCTHRPL
jgi:hypothetical protein